jgi:hypothetical protein
MAHTVSIPCEFEVHFRSLLRHGVELAVPCDREGHVDLDGLSHRAKTEYLFARAMVGREYAVPTVRRRETGQFGPDASPRVARWFGAGRGVRA